MSQFDPVDSSDSTTVFPYHDLTPPEPVLRGRLADLVRVPEADIWESVTDLLATERLVIEGTSASAVVPSPVGTSRRRNSDVL